MSDSSTKLVKFMDDKVGYLAIGSAGTKRISVLEYRYTWVSTYVVGTWHELFVILEGFWIAGT